LSGVEQAAKGGEGAEPTQVIYWDYNDKRQILNIRKKTPKKVVFYPLGIWYND
jgi:hypothetical protein